MGNSNEYLQNDQDWTLTDMITFNRHVIDEKVVVCQWVDQGTLCSDLVKGRDFKAHLHHKHGVTDDSHQYLCLWHDCTTIRSMKRSSLERHMKEQHIPVKWACPRCEQTFTRENTLMDHIKRSPGHA